MNKQKLKRFLDIINDLIEKNGEDAPITLGNLRDIIQENLLRKELNEAQESFFVTQSDIDLATAQLSQERLQKWLESHYLITGSLQDAKTDFKKHFPNIGTGKTPAAFVETFGIL